LFSVCLIGVSCVRVPFATNPVPHGWKLSARMLNQPVTLTIAIKQQNLDDLRVCFYWAIVLFSPLITYNF
jgi:hypothetical protein